MHRSLDIKNPTAFLEDFLRRFTRSTGICREQIVAEIRKHHDELGDERRFAFSEKHKLSDRLKSDDAKIGQMFSDGYTVRFPLELFESTIKAVKSLNREWGLKLEIELGERRDVMIIPRPKTGPSADADNLGRMAKEHGEALIAIAAMLDDGVIDEKDIAKIPAAIEELDQSVACQLEMRAKLKKILEGESKTASVTHIKERHG